MFRNRKSLIFLSILVLTAVFLTGCGKKESTTDNSAPSQPALTESEMEHFKSNLGFMARSEYQDLEGVPLYVGSTEIDNSRSLSGSVLTAAFNIMAQIDEFTTFYEREFPNFGWDLLKNEVTDTRVKLEATKSGRLATITADIEDGTITEYKLITD
ncbi:MAG: hypothetical protein PHD88_03080 [Firmicutes bacterium]|nr:hypothetical protein [Bacillota bacterium]MDD4264172.1 hypothetical protein [Bacillota bacterium]MDD4693373.1 hypothetical protein [Bacillota bacterium]